MTDSGCDKAKQDLEEYLRNELKSDEASDIAEHIDNCADCESERRVGVVLTLAVQRACQETAPEVLRDQVLARLREVQAHQASPVQASPVQAHQPAGR